MPSEASSRALRANHSSADTIEAVIAAIGAQILTPQCSCFYSHALQHTADTSTTSATMAAATASGTAALYGPLLCVATPAKTPFKLDPEQCGTYLKLSSVLSTGSATGSAAGSAAGAAAASSDCMTATNTAHKRWSAVRGTHRMSRGVHSWSVRVDRYVR
jgi:hypothetical protein